MKCPGCGYENKPNAVICGLCQAALNKPIVPQAKKPSQRHGSPEQVAAAHATAAAPPATPPKAAPRPGSSSGTTTAPAPAAPSAPPAATTAAATNALGNALATFDARHPNDAPITYGLLAGAAIFLAGSLYMFTRGESFGLLLLFPAVVLGIVGFWALRSGVHDIRTTVLAIDAGNADPGFVAERVDHHERGVAALQRGGGDALLIPWGRVREVVEQRLRYQGSIATAKKLLVTVVRDDGARFTFPDCAVSESLFQAVFEPTRTRLLEDARKALNSGQAVFGALEVARPELRWVDPQRGRSAPRKTLPWDQVARLRWDSGKLVAEAKDGTRHELCRGVDVPNRRVFEALLRDDFKVEVA